MKFLGDVFLIVLIFSIWNTGPVFSQNSTPPRIENLNSDTIHYCSDSILVVPDISIQNTEIRVYFYSTTMFEDGAYIAPFYSISKIQYDFTYSSLYSANNSNLQYDTSFSKLGLVGGYKWQWSNFNIALDIGYANVFGDFIDKLEASSDSSVTDIYKTVLGISGSLRLGWAF